MSRKAFVFSASMALLLAHEVEAAYRKEWKLLPVLRSMQESHAAMVFTLLHIPLFLLLLLALSRFESRRSAAIRGAFAVFAVMHVGLHAFWPRSELYNFDNPISTGLIYGAGICGGAYLLLK